MSADAPNKMKVTIRQRRPKALFADSASPAPDKSEGGAKANEEYKVGYGCPPRHTQFKKNESGNLKGRPRGAKGFNSTLRKVLKTTVPAKINGRTVRMTKLEGVCHRLVDKALGGHVPSILALIKLDPTAQELFAAGAREAVAALEDEDAAVLSAFFKSLPQDGANEHGGHKGGDDEGSGHEGGADENAADERGGVQRGDGS
jgi:hypothetical protein